MRKGIVFFLMLVWCSLFSGQGWAMEAVAVSPALDGGEALVSVCRPTFCWSQVEGAEAYEMMVFEAVNGETNAREDMVALYKPVISTIIPAPALSWTPSSESCLTQGGVYVWYVRGVDPDGSGVWSGGSRFSVDLGPSLSLVENKVDEALTVYFSNEETVEQTFSGLETRIIESVKEGIQSGEIIAQGSEGDEQHNTYYGHGAGDSLDGTGKDNVFVGYNAGSATTSGAVNTFIGFYAGHKNTTPSNNTFVGGYAGQDNTTGFSNAFVGRQAGYFNTTGCQNTFVGMSAGTSNTTGHHNTFLGFAAGYSNTTSSYNTFVGRSAGHSNTTGKHNTFLGYGAGESNTTGDSNTFFGLMPVTTTKRVPETSFWATRPASTK